MSTFVIAFKSQGNNPWGKKGDIVTHIEKATDLKSAVAQADKRKPGNWVITTVQDVTDIVDVELILNSKV